MLYIISVFAFSVCGIEFNATGTREINIDQRVLRYVDGYCDALKDYNDSGKMNGITMNSRSFEDLKITAFAARLQESQVRFDLYAEMFAVGSPEIEVGALDAQWVESVKDYLYDLDKLVPTPNIREKWKQYDTSGRLVGIPVIPNQITMYYRKDLFDKYGRTWKHDTWENFEETLLYIQEKEREDRRSRGLSDDFWGFTIPTDKSANRMTYMLVSLLSGHDGGGIVDSTGKVTINNPRAIEAINRWASWFKDGPKQMTSKECFGQSTSGATRFFLADKSAAIIVWSSDHSEKMNKKMAENSSWVIRSAPIPGPNAAGCSGHWSAVLSIHTREKEVALDWLKLHADNSHRLRLVGREPVDQRVITDKTLWAEYCVSNPVICKSYEEYPEFWSRLSHRPAAGCGTLYPQCASLIYKHMYTVFTLGITGDVAAKGLEEDLNLLLGHIEASALNKKTGEWKTGSRIALMIVASFCAVVLVILIVIVKKQSSKMRTAGISIPVSVMLTLVATAALGTVLGIVISDMDSNTRSISEDLAKQVRVQSLRTVQAALLGIIDGLIGSTSRKTIADFSIAKMKTDLGQMSLDRRNLVLLIDRNFPNTVLVTSDRVKQQDRVGVLDPENQHLLHPWTSSILNLYSGWREDIFDETATTKITSAGEKLHVNMLSVDYVSRTGERDMSFLVVYITPEAVILEEAVESREVSVNYALLLSITAVVVIIGCTILITSPIARLAIDMEYVQHMELNHLNTVSSSLTEIQSLLIGFKSMCAMLTEYKAFLPKSVFVDEMDSSDSVSAPSTDAGSARLSSSLSNAKIRARPLLTEVNKTKDATGTLMVFKLHEAEKLMSRSDAAATVGCIVQSLETQSITYKGTLHPLNTISPSEFTMSWGYASTDCDAALKAAKCAIALKENSPAPVGCFFSVSIATAKAKVGNLGTTATRGFGVTGAVCHLIRQVVAVGNSLSKYATCILAEEGACERLAVFTKVPVEIVLDTNNTKKIIKELRSMVKVDGDEWMYQLQQCEDKGLVSPLIPSFVLLASDKLSEAVELLQSSDDKDHVVAFVLENLRNRIAMGAKSYEACCGMVPCSLGGRLENNSIGGDLEEELA